MNKSFQYGCCGVSMLVAAIAGCQIESASKARASDMDFSQSVGDQGHFVRIGLNKSVVVRLPAEARDVIVGNPEIVDAVVRTKNTAYLFARKAGQTNIFFFDAAGRQIMNIDLEVAIDGQALQKLINRTLPGSHIQVDTMDDKVVLRGVAANAQEAKIASDMAAIFVNTAGGGTSGGGGSGGSTTTAGSTGVVNAMTISEGDQVMIKVRVMEVKRDLLKQLGINIDNLAFNMGKFAFNLATANPWTTSYLAGGLTYNSSNLNLNSTINAMESDGLMRTLAEPTLSAVSGQAATFLAGGQFPYVACTTGSNPSCNTEFKDYGVSLGFTPTVLTGGRISVKIDTTVSDLDYTNTVSGVAGLTNGVPGLTTRSAATTLELPSGGSMMLAGLIKDINSQTIAGTPGLKNIPILGALFRSRDFASHQTELVVIVTPYIVNPVSEKELATPGQGIANASDKQTILFGKLNQVYGSGGHAPQGTYHGNVGYIYE